MERGAWQAIVHGIARVNHYSGTKPQEKRIYLIMTEYFSFLSSTRIVELDLRQKYYDTSNANWFFSEK